MLLLKTTSHARLLSRLLISESMVAQISSEQGQVRDSFKVGKSGSNVAFALGVIGDWLIPGGSHSCN